MISLKLIFCNFPIEGLGHSAILQNNDNYLSTLSNWLKPVVQSKSSYWKRCWRASLDGWALSTFHSRCDGKGPTVTIIKVQQYIFGGYTSTSWSKFLFYFFFIFILSNLKFTCENHLHIHCMNSLDFFCTNVSAHRIKRINFEGKHL